MNDEDRQQEGNPSASETKNYNKGLWVVIVILMCAVVVALGYGLYQKNLTSNLSSANSNAETRLAETGQQVQMLSQKVNALEASEAAAAHPKPVASRLALKREAHARRRPAVDRYKKLEAELAVHQKEIDATQQSVNSARTEIAGSLSAAQTELGGSIAKNHSELVTLERKGERNYFEFGLPKSKRFNRAGPVSIKLRKANTKHEYADLELIVNDREVTKKHVNIYEPVMFYPADGEPPVQLVINGIQKNFIRGYVSTPKYTASQLSAANPATSAPAAGAMTPGPVSTPVATPVELERRPQP